MNVSWRVTTEPTEVISLDIVKLHTRVDVSDEDALAATWPTAARQACEQYTGRPIGSQVITAVFDDWFSVAWLPMAAPLISLDGITYRAADGTVTTLDTSAYVVDASNEPARLAKAPTSVWPSLQPNRLAPITVTYTAGYTAATLPKPLFQGMLLMIEHFNANRGAVNVGNITTEIPLGVTALWAPYQVRWRAPLCE